MVTGMTPSMWGIASFYRQNSVDLGKTLLRLASGKNINYPSDDAVGYIRAKSFDNQARQYENIKRELSEWESAMNVASSAAGEILDNLNRMKELIYMAAQTSVQQEKDAYQSEFYQLAVSNRSIVENTNWQGKSLLNNSSIIATISLAPGSSTYTLSLEPGVAIVQQDLDPLIEEIATHQLNDTTQDRINAEEHVDSALSQIKPFIATVAGYVRALQSQQNVGDAIIENLKSAESAIMDIDEAKEMIAFTAKNIRRQTSIAMLAQANASVGNILWLYGIKNGG